MQQKQMRRSRIIPAITPMTIPAIAPPDRPLLELPDVTGRDEPEAVAGAMNGSVVVAETVDVCVETPPEVGRRGAE
jgi:hypothetical protein